VYVVWGFKYKGGPQMAYLLSNGSRNNLTNFKNIEMRCICNKDFYTLIKNPIYIVLRDGKDPTLFKSTSHEPYDEAHSFDRAISFSGCICELERISTNYRIYGAKIPLEYNWSTEIRSKKTYEIIRLSSLDSELFSRWGKLKNKLKM